MRHRIPRALARLIGEAARPGVGRLLAAVLVLTSLGATAYAVLTVGQGGAPAAQAGSAGASAHRAGQPESRDGARPGTPDGTSTPASPTPSSPTASAATSTSAAPTTPAAGERGERRVRPSSTPRDSEPPATRLSGEYPERDSATFTFGADEPASYTCSLDGGAFTSCESPTQYSDLTPGWHTFAVRATDAAGNVDPTPAQTRWHAADGRAAAQ